MQQSVIIGFLLTLLSKRRVSRKYLAEKYELSVRTVARYIDAMSAAGVPIITFMGKDGGYAIYDDFSVDRLYLTVEERSRILDCLKSTGEKINEQIIDKINRLNQIDAVKESLFRTESIVIASANWTNPQLYRTKISVIARAIRENRVLSMVYRDRHDITTDRLFEPQTLVFKEGVWYAYGFCRTRSDFRLFRLSRMQSLLLLDQTFQPQEGDLQEKLDGMLPSTATVDITIEFSSLRLPDIEEWLGTDSIRERGLRYTAVAHVPSGSSLIAKLMSFGSDIRVIAPAALREELLLECRRMIEYNT